MDAMQLNLEDKCDNCGRGLRLQVTEQEDILIEFTCQKCGFKFSDLNKQLIFVGDAGWESLIGGSVIGVYDSLSEEFESKTIGVEHFQNFMSADSKHLDEVVSAVDTFFAKRNINPDTHLIFITNTHLMSKVREYLEARHYDWFRFEILEPLHSPLKKAFEEHLLSLGVPGEAIEMQSKPRKQYLMSWVMADESREKLIKKAGI